MEKCKKHLEILSFYICAPEIQVIWCLYGSWDIKCQGHRFLSFWAIFNPQNQNFEKTKKCLGILSLYTCVPQMTIMMYDFWYIKHYRQNFLSFWAIFCPFTPLTIQKIKILKKWKNPEDIIILHLSTTNGNHMMYGSWDMEFSRQNLFSFWTIVCPFTEKSKFWKISLKISPAYTCVPQMTIKWCIVPEI